MKYNEYSSKIATLLSTQHSDEKIKQFESVSDMIGNRLSNIGEDGKQKLIAKKETELERLAAEIAVPARDLLRQFCNEFTLAFPEDGADHGVDVSNALKVIEMCGNSLTADLYASLIEPLQGSFKVMQIINNVLVARRKNQATATEGYDSEMQRIVREWENFCLETDEFTKELNSIKAIADSQTLIDFRLSWRELNDLLSFSVIDKTRYSVYALPDTITKLGEQRESLISKYPLLLKN